MTNELDSQRIRKGIQMLCSVFRTRMDKDGLEFWVSKLEDHSGPKLWAALKAALDGDHMPALKDIRTAASEAAKPNAYKEPPQPTPQEKRRADHAGIMSLLWMRQHGYGADDMAYIMLARMFPGDVNKALAAAREIYTPGVVDKWMEDQKRAGN